MAPNPDLPDISVVVPAGGAPLRLRWLLNALEEQTLERSRFEVVVADDSPHGEAEDLVRDHPLARDGVVRHLRLEPARPSGARLRNAGWRAARAPVIAFTEERCRPAPEWLAQALVATRRNPGAIVQGMTLADPVEAINLQAPHPRSEETIPPDPWARMYNIVYPREALERLGGLLEEPPLAAGEDTELALRAREAGIPCAGDRALLVYHAVAGDCLHRHLRSHWRWGDLAFVVKRHPSARRQLHLRIFWRRSHVWFPLALLGLTVRRSPLWPLALLPWTAYALPDRGGDRRGRARSLSELPGRFAIDAAAYGALIAGSVRHRTLLL